MKGSLSMVVELISVGTEILLGNIVNTNANYLAVKCAELGLSLYYQVAVGDNAGRLTKAIKTALSRSDIVILTGGLGPTQDDLTKETAAKVLGKDLVMDEHSRNRITEYFSGRSIEGDSAELAKITENNWKQAMKIDGCTVIDNENGTAPGYIAEDAGKTLILLPGPPGEMIPMFRSDIFPYLKKLQDRVFVSRMVKLCGIGESRAETEILDLINGQVNPTIAPYAKNGEVHFRVTASAASQDEAEAILNPLINELKKRFLENIYTTDEDETLEAVVVDLLKKHNLKLAAAESCTGGMLTSRIVNVPGASDVLQEGFITYSNSAKCRYLGVSSETLEEFGAVSSQTAREMADGAADVSGCEVSVSVTGIAGPGGGTAKKPVGLIFIACHIGDETTVKELRLKGSREKIREASVINALDLIRRCILKKYPASC